jgi:hypothetical protein
LNLALLAVALLVAAGAWLHRQRLDRRYEELLRSDQTAPAEMMRIRTELANMNVTRDALRAELESRMAFIENQRSDRFYLAIDTAAQKLILHYGNDVVRVAPLQTGPPLSLQSPAGRSWTIPVLKGGFTLRGKEEGASWRIPEWVYLMNQEHVPEERPLVENGLGRYVLYLPNNYVIHSPPDPASPLKGAKPGSFMVPEQDLRAIWPRVDQKTRVFIF